MPDKALEQQIEKVRREVAQPPKQDESMEKLAKDLGVSPNQEYQD